MLLPSVLPKAELLKKEVLLLFTPLRKMAFIPSYFSLKTATKTYKQQGEIMDILISLLSTSVFFVGSMFNKL